MTALSRFMTCAAAFCLGTATQAVADPIQITGGFMDVTSLGTVAPIQIAGTRGFSFNGVAHPTEAAIDAFSGCTPCTPGEMISLSAILFNAFSGTATLEGNTYDVTDSVDPDASMNWSISAPSVTAPAQASTMQFLQAPFTLTGHFTPDATPDVPPIEIIPLIGRGTVTLSLKPIPPGDEPIGWQTVGVRYAFSDATVPEPASLILIGIGTAMCGLRRVLGTRRDARSV